MRPGEDDPWHTRSMADLDDLARQLGGLLDRVARRSVRWATRVAIVTAIAAAVMYLLGLQALDDGAGDVWRWLGAIIGIVAVAAPAWAAWQLRSVHRDARGIVADVRTLLDRDADAQRIVIDTVEVSEATGERSAVPYRAPDMSDLRRVVMTGADLKSLPLALAALGSLPIRLFVGVLATLAFAFVGFIFLLILAF